MELNYDNYHSLEANRLYMSRSLYTKFRKCEADAMAYLAGTWAEETSEAFLVGQYVHSWSSGTQAEFIAEHPGMFTKSGGLRAEYKTADKMIAMLEADPMAMYMLQGETEVIFTAEFAGVMWKIMIDVYNPERKRIVELKTSKNLRETYWCPTLERRVSFVEQYYYLMQAALYCEIERRASGRPEGDWFDNYMVAVSKENVPDKEIIDLRDPERYASELATIERSMERIIQVKAGELEPFRCERCDYCRSTRMLERAIHYSEL